MRHSSRTEQLLIQQLVSPRFQQSKIRSEIVVIHDQTREARVQPGAQVAWEVELTSDNIWQQATMDQSPLALPRTNKPFSLLLRTTNNKTTPNQCCLLFRSSNS